MAGETVHIGHTQARNGNSRDASDQSVGQNNEYVRIHNDGSPAVHRPVHPHECCAADRCRHREEAAAGPSAPVDVYSSVDDNKRRKNPSHGNENATGAKPQYKRPALDYSSDHGEVYASVDKTKVKNTPPVRTAVDDDVYASVDKNKGRKPAGGKKDKKKSKEVLHMDGRKGACAAAAMDDEIVMYDNPCFLEGAANLEETGEIYINLDEKIKLSHPDVEDERQQRFENMDTSDGRLKYFLFLV